jgi:hypothetical protein
MKIKFSGKVDISPALPIKAQNLLLAPNSTTTKTDENNGEK